MTDTIDRPYTFLSPLEDVIKHALTLGFPVVFEARGVAGSGTTVALDAHGLRREFYSMKRRFPEGHFTLKRSEKPK